MNRWRKDWEIPFKLGIKQVIGENGGPGGLFHTLRMVPPVLAICSDMEDLCPDALLLNYTNPVPRLCLAVERYTDISVLGLCHEVEHQMKRLAPIMGMPFSLLDAVSAGLNHFSWFKELRLNNGDDAYLLLDEGLKGVDPTFQPLCRAIYDRFGLYPSSAGNHVGARAPEFVKTLVSDFEPTRLQSTFHARLLDDWYGLEIEPTLINPDGAEVGHLHFYDTAKRVG